MEPADQEIIEPNVNKENLQISPETVRLDIYQHMRAGIKNKEYNCMCINDPENLYYCIPCKASCCNKCSLPEHSKHLLLEKEKYDLLPQQIDDSFGAETHLVRESDLFRNLENRRKEMLQEIDNTYQKIVDMAAEWRDKKHREINSLFDDLIANVKLCEDKKQDSIKVLNNFANKHKTFFSLRDKNFDPHNTIFLIAYDLLSITYLWSEKMEQIGKNIEKDMSEYKNREENRDKIICEKIHKILFLSDDEDLETGEKIDEKLLPLIKLNSEIKDFNPEKLKDIEKRLAKLNKCIDSFKHSVLNSINKWGNYKELARENNVFEHRRVKGADNLFSQRKLDTMRQGDENYLNPGRLIKTKNDVILDNPILQRNFAHVLTDLFNMYFRIPTIELQSSHADLKIKLAEEMDANYVKILEGTNQIMIYDKKLCKITKKKLNLLKNPHGYTKFPLGCRWVLLGDKLYITGGKDEFREYPVCLIYDRKTEKIKRIMDMQNPRCYHTMVFNDVFETMMVIGGEHNCTVEIFDPMTSRWQLLPELNIPRAIPLFYFDEGRGNMYAFFGVEGDYQKPKHTDTIEILDLTEINQGWMKIIYNNKARMDFKCFLNLYPLNDYLLLIYGGVESRDLKRNACVYNLVKTEMTKIDKNLMEELRNEAKTNKLLSNIVASVSRASISSEVGPEASKVLK